MNRGWLVGNDSLGSDVCGDRTHIAECGGRHSDTRARVRRMICVASSVAGSPCGAEEGDDSHCLRERRIGWECPSDVGGESVAAIAAQVLGRQRRVQAA